MGSVIIISSYCRAEVSLINWTSWFLNRERCRDQLWTQKSRSDVEQNERADIAWSGGLGSFPFKPRNSVRSENVVHTATQHYTTRCWSSVILNHLVCWFMPTRLVVLIQVELWSRIACLFFSLLCLGRFIYTKVLNWVSPGIQPWFRPGQIWIFSLVKTFLHGFNFSQLPSSSSSSCEYTLMSSHNEAIRVALPFLCVRFSFSVIVYIMTCPCSGIY